MDRRSKEKQGLRITSNRQETSKAVLDVLRIDGEQGLLFLKDCADEAVAILYVFQSCDVESVVKKRNLLDLVLDGCGLVYIIVHACSEHMDRQTIIARNMKDDAQILAKLRSFSSRLYNNSVDQYRRELKSINALVSKMVADKNLRHHNPLKRAKDERRINDFRDKLKLHMAKFGRTTTKSIHDTLDELMAEKLNEQNSQKKDEAKKTKESVASIQANGLPASDLENLHIRSDDPRTHNTVPAIRPPVSHPENIHIRNDETQNSTYSPMPVSMPMPSPAVQSSQNWTTTHQPDFPVPISSGTAADLRSKLNKKREEGRKVEEGTLKVPEEYYQPSGFWSTASQSQPHSHTPFAAEKTGSGISEKENEDIARALQKQFEREHDEILHQEQQDREAAMREAAQEQLRAEEEIKISKQPHPISPTSAPPARPGPHPSQAYLYSFENITNSGISLGGGPVYINNGRGDITNTSYSNSFNDRSVTHHSYIPK